MDSVLLFKERGLAIKIEKGCEDTSWTCEKNVCQNIVYL